MPIIDRIAGYSVGFYSNDGVEPPHVHVRRDRARAKFWLSPVRLGRARGFATHELNWMRRIIEARESVYLERWNEQFSR